MKTVIHIGCPKTGTTTLQRHLFRELPQTHYLGHYSRINPKLHKVPHGARDAGELAAEWRQAVAAAPAETTLLLYSQEKLTYYPASLAPEVADAIHKIVGDAEVLITIRRQPAICVSNYFNFTARGYPHDFDTFMKEGLATLETSATMATHRSEESIWGLWLYDDLFRAWEERFGTVHVLPLEAWKQQPDQARAALAAALGRDVDDIVLPSAHARSRASNTPWRRHLPRPLEQFLKRLPLPEWAHAKMSKGLDIELTPEQLQTIEATYGPGNRWLAERTGWDLKALGYPGWPTE